MPRKTGMNDRQGTPCAASMTLVQPGKTLSLNGINKCRSSILDRTARSALICPRRRGVTTHHHATLTTGIIFEAYEVSHRLFSTGLNILGVWHEKR